MSALRPATLALLEGARPLQPFFSNVQVFEAFELAHTRGALKLLPHAGGGYFVYDTGAALGRGTLSKPMPLAEAHDALVKMAAKR